MRAACCRQAQPADLQPRRLVGGVQVAIEHLGSGVEQAGHEPFVPRISLSLSAIASAKQVMFLITGAEKADAVAGAFGPDAVPNPHIPASLLPPLADDVIVLLDEAAAAKL